MTRSPVRGWAVALAAVALAACGEQPQTITPKKVDVQAYQGAASSPYLAAGWKPGDLASWELQMRRRAQGQNEYVRNAP